jgi:hypothetical protein
MMGQASARPNLREAADAATVIVFGQVEKIDRSRGRPIATMHVEHVAKGNGAETMSFFADPHGQYEPSVTIGARALAFLEPIPGEPGFQTVLKGAGCIDAFPHDGMPYVAMSGYSGMQIPAEICRKEVNYGLYECTAPLQAVLATARLVPMPTGSTRSATFRRAIRECTPCELTQALRHFSAPDAVDCSSEPVECVRTALNTHRAFVAKADVPGIDSAISEAFVQRGEHAMRLWYDSSVEGGGSCAAAVFAEDCERVGFEKGKKLVCKGPRERVAFCAQAKTRVELLGPATSVSQLHCAPRTADGRYEDCSVGDSRVRSVAPPETGPDLVCGERVMGFSCREL